MLPYPAVRSLLINFVHNFIQYDTFLASLQSRSAVVVSMVAEISLSSRYISTYDVAGVGGDTPF